MPIWSHRLTLLAALLLGTVFSAGSAQLEEWAVPPGYSLTVDSRGFEIPSAIAFVPEPGDAPDDPLYFVTELKGTIKVVTRDRSVRVFAQVPTFQGQTLELSGASQQGLAGICLDAETGYVFATFTYNDTRDILRNNLVRFSTRPGTFAAEPGEVREFPELFADYQSSPAHQIGNCVIQNGRLYVGVGDGGNASAARNPGILLGKVLCLDLSGAPCRTPSGSSRAADYVYASGFRNPFGLAFARGQLFAAENGIDIDRFLRVEAGGDYNWDGSDQSIAAGADLTIVPAISPVQMAFIPEDAPFVGDDLRGTFAFAVFGPEEVNPGVVALRYDFERGKVLRPPRYALEYVGQGLQHVTGFAVGPDGLYAVPNVPGPDGESVILKLRYDPANAHPTTVVPRSKLVAPASLGLLNDYPCTSCHAISGQGGSIGPALDRFGFNWRITERLNSDSYRRQVEAVDSLEREPYPSWREARREVLAASGRERTYVWLKYFLQNPKFDNPDVQMPNLGLSEQEALAIRDELYRILELEVPRNGFDLQAFGARTRAFAQRNRRPLGLGLAAGLLLGLLVALVPWMLGRKRRDSTRR